MGAIGRVALLRGIAAMLTPEYQQMTIRSCATTTTKLLHLWGS